MILIGDSLIPCENIFRIFHKEQIAETPANSTIIFKYNADIVSYVSQNDVSYGVMVSSITEAIYANALNAKYIICAKAISKDIQMVAENYMFDSKILAIITSNTELEEIARNEIDGVIYKEILD